ncbi:PRK06851 family protein [Desulfosporosinus burensis]
MSSAHIKKMFPGAVTSQGFYSYYQYMIQQNANHIFVIKGGPGVGKSSFMKKIGQTMLEQGYDLEYHCCSSDNGSIDGIVIPQLNIALLDGTAPHVVDPKNPGAVDEIINLGDYWNEEMLKQSREEIKNCNLKVSSYFQRAYFALKEAKIALDEWKYYISSYQNWNQINLLTLKIEREMFKITPKNAGNQRHLFAWAHTPQGKTEYIDTLVKGTETLYTLIGQPGTGKSTFLARIAERAITFGLDVEYYHNTLNPEQLDLIILPDLRIALVINSEPYAYTSNYSGNIITLDFEQSLNGDQFMKECGEEITDCRIRVNQHIARALGHSKKAKATHDLLETYYVPAMNFLGIEEKYKSVLERILAYQDEPAIAVHKESSKPQDLT